MKLKPNSDFLKVGVDWIVSNAEHILIRATPILSPLPSAFAITYALDRAGWGYPVLLASIIEAMGVCAGGLIGYIATHNKRHARFRIHENVGYGLFGFYVLIAALIIGGYETLPTLSEWVNGAATSGELIKSVVPLLFPGLTLIGAVIVALRQYMQRMDAEADHERERAEASENAQRQRQDADHGLDMEIKRMEAEQRLALQRAEAEQKMAIERQRAEAKLAQLVAQPPQPTPQPVAQPPATKADRLDGILRTLLEITDPAQINKAELGRQYNVTRQQIAKDMDELIESGKLVINGKVQVVG